MAPSGKRKCVCTQHLSHPAPAGRHWTRPGNCSLKQNHSKAHMFHAEGVRHEGGWRVGFTRNTVYSMFCLVLWLRLFAKSLRTVRWHRGSSAHVACVKVWIGTNPRYVHAARLARLLNHQFGLFDLALVLGRLEGTQGEPWAPEKTTSQTEIFGHVGDCGKRTSCADLPRAPAEKNPKSKWSIWHRRFNTRASTLKF